MLLAALKNLEVCLGAQTLFRLENLEIHLGDKIGFLGTNGSGKSTLLKLLLKEILPEQGEVYCHKSVAYLEQLQQKESLAKSGGEINKEKLQELFARNVYLLLLDEPDNHLDKNTLKYLARELKKFSGSFLLISHNRTLLAEVCNKYWLLAEGKIQEYNTGLAEVFAQRELEMLTQQSNYEKYLSCKQHLEASLHKAQRSSAKVKKTPSRMGNSESRLHKMGDQRAKANFDKTARRAQSKLAQLEKVAKPPVEQKIKLALAACLKVHHPILLHTAGLSKSYGTQPVFAEASFQLFTGAKVALLGENGSGKSTLLQLIKNKDSQISFTKNVKIGYLDQFCAELALNESVLANVEKVSLYPLDFTRTVLARLLFRAEAAYKKCRVLSGGELTRVALAMLMLGDYNLLLLDEPTNHLDLFSLQAVEEALQAYEGTIIFTSHDELFKQKIASESWKIVNKKLARQVF